jgi:MoxR-like ATPase
MQDKIQELKNEISKAIIGQENVVDSLILGLLCDGHVLLEHCLVLLRLLRLKV